MVSSSGSILQVSGAQEPSCTLESIRRCQVQHRYGRSAGLRSHHAPQSLAGFTRSRMDTAGQQGSGAAVQKFRQELPGPARVSSGHQAQLCKSLVPRSHQVLLSLAGAPRPKVVSSSGSILQVRRAQEPVCTIESSRRCQVQHRWGLLDISTCRQIYKLNTQVQGHFINKSILYIKNMYFYISNIFCVRSFSIKLVNSFKSTYL